MFMYDFFFFFFFYCIQFYERMVFVTEVTIIG